MQLSISSAGSVSRATHIATDGILALCGLLFILILTVVFFNWPKFVVPPSQRGECGAIAEWRGKNHVPKR
jgi:hypothetical protein